MTDASPRQPAPGIDLESLLAIDVDRWRREMQMREEHLAQFHGLPEAIWVAHRRVTNALDAQTPVPAGA